MLNLLAWSHPSEVALQTRVSMAALLALVLAAANALGNPRDGWRYWAREFLPVPVLPFIYLNLRHVIPVVNPRILDEVLLNADRVLLGSRLQTAVYTVPLPAVLTELLTLAYASFFFLPIALLIAMGMRRDPALPQVVSAILFTFLVSYVGYFIIPAYGPKATVSTEHYLALEPGLVGGWVRNLLEQWGKTKTDVFPSGHTMVTLAVLFCTRRRAPVLFRVMLPVGVLLIAATVLLTFHYVIDLVVAVPLTVFTLATSARFAGPVPPRLPSAES